MLLGRAAWKTADTPQAAARAVSRWLHDGGPVLSGRVLAVVTANGVTLHAREGGEQIMRMDWHDGIIVQDPWDSCAYQFRKVRSALRYAGELIAAHAGGSSQGSTAGRNDASSDPAPTGLPGRGRG